MSCCLYCSPTAADIDECNAFKFMAISIFFPEVYNTTDNTYNEDLAFELVLDLVSKYTPIELQALVHQPAVRTITKSGLGDYSFCDNRCAILVAYAGLLQGFRPVSGNYYQLLKGACTDTFSNQWYA